MTADPLPRFAGRTTNVDNHQETTMNQLFTHFHHFEGQALVTITWQGRPCWVARQIGAHLGYSHEGKRLPNKILGDWSDEFIAGRDFALLQGEDLTTFQAALAAVGIDGGIGRGSLVVLFESGLHLVLAKTDLPAGKRLRRFLVDEVLPQLVRTGRYAPDAWPREPEAMDGTLSLFPQRAVHAQSLPVRREARLLLQARTRERWVELCDRRLQVSTLHRLVDAISGMIDDATRAALEIIAAEIATGIDLAEILSPEPAPNAARSDAATRAA